MVAVKPIFVGGTASHSGKSWMTTAICRWLKRRGARVAPFKAQNMSNNACPCAGGGEIGRAQAVQAEACGLAPETDMNPVLLKPNSAMGSQVIVDGEVWRNLSAREYYENFDFLLGRVVAAYERLAARFEYIVIEGAGSVSELNLKSTDLVNLGLARRISAPALLVADIDRGGVFASVVGTFGLLEPEERGLVRSFAVNRFRGDPSLFADGVRLLENKTGAPCLGVFPYSNDIRIDEEDSVALDDLAGGGDLPVAIVRFPRISNFTDFRLLDRASWITAPVDRQFRAVILPGSKNTIGDLAWLRAQGLDEWLLRQHAAGARVIGICGGFQMLGERIIDPTGVESGGEAEGLNLLPVSTKLRGEKTVRNVEATTPGGIRFPAYEIHMGVTRGFEGHFARRNGCVGTYLHGALEHSEVLEELLGFSVPALPPKAEMYDRLAEWFDNNADVRRFEELYL